MQTTGQRLKEIMRLRRLRQVDVVEMARPYCEKYNRILKKNALSQYVNDKAEPKRDMIALLAEALNVDDAWLLGYDVPMERKTPTIDIGESEREKLMRDLFKRLSPSEQMDTIIQMERKLKKE